ncbi:MAG TPA: outer membrane protein assembly factor BamE [Steroidobacteraceae bacterium]|nr:outer membrane protein assembly factor BamE [Steroidobacteraceae bacterium]
MKFQIRALTLRAALLVLLAAFASGCIYRLPIQQGNFLEDKELDKITVGMTRTQVRYLLGTPMVADPFETSRWDYVYTFKIGNVAKENRRHFIVHFEDDKVVKIERNTAS